MPHLTEDQITRCSPVVLLALTQPHHALKVEGAYLGTFPAGGESQSAAELLLSDIARCTLDNQDAARSITGWVVMHVTDARRAGYFGVALAVTPRPECAKDTRRLAGLAGKVAAHIERLYVAACDAALRQHSLLDNASNGYDDDRLYDADPDPDSELGAQRLIAALARGPLTVRVLGTSPVDLDPLGKRRSAPVPFLHVGMSALHGIVDHQSWRRGRAELHGQLQSLDGDGTEATRNIQVGVTEDCFKALLPHFVERTYCEFTVDVYHGKGILGGTLVRYALKSFRVVPNADMPLFK